MSIGAECIDVCNAFLNWVKRSQRIIPRLHPVKVNVGSYLIVEKGWINVEGSINAFLAKRTRLFARLMYRFSRVNELFKSESDYINVLKHHEFVHHDLCFGLPFPDHSIDYIYTSHTLEHFYPDVAQNLLLEAHRTLKSGGRIRVCVPDLEHAFVLYSTGQKKKALEYFFQDSRSTRFHRHRYMYDFELLQSVLQKAGFTFIERCGYRQGHVPDIEKLDNRPEETLFVEAVK
jgi:SAM-dependent methyltransferase